jgi:hypothetical protein
MKVHTCPVCHGTGLVSIPPGVAGDLPTFTSTSIGPWPCRVCAGQGVLWEPEPED